MSYYCAKIHSVLIVSSSRRYLGKIKAALEFLRRAAPVDFRRVTRLLRFIFITDRVKTVNQLFTKERAWFIGHRLITDRSYPSEYLASLLVHEAYHIAQHFGGHKNVGSRAERNAYLVQRRFLHRVDYPIAVEWLDRQYARKWWKIMERDRKSSAVFRQLWREYLNGTLPIKPTRV